MNCFQDSIKTTLKEDHSFPYILDKEIKVRGIFKAAVLECGKANIKPAASVLITYTFLWF